jgi:hypothetical protein
MLKSIRQKPPKIGTVEYLEWVQQVFPVNESRRSTITKKTFIIKRNYKPKPHPRTPPYQKQDCLCRGIPRTEVPDYTVRDTKMIANELFCQTIKNMGLTHDGMISVLEETSLNTLEHLIKYDVIGSSVVNLINWDKTKCAEMLCKISNSPTMKDLNIQVSCMKSTLCLLNNKSIHRAVWFDYTCGASKSIIYDDILKIFQSGMLSFGGVLGVTFTVRNAPMDYNEANQKIHIIAQAYNYQLKCVKVNGTPYIDEICSSKYKGVVLFIYEVRPMAN